MPSPAKLAQIERSRAGRKPGPAAPADAPPADAAAAADKQLDDPANQEAILNPEPLIATIGGNAVELYPLSAKRKRQFTGLYAEIMSEVVKRRVSGQSIGMRVAGVLSEDEIFSDKFMQYVARALAPADRLTPEHQIAVIANDIDEKTTFSELSILFLKMVEMNDVASVFGSPGKN